MTKRVSSKTLREVSWRKSRLVRELDPQRIEACERDVILRYTDGG